MSNPILIHAPALVIAIPLLGAFLTPVISKYAPKFRMGWVLAILAITEVLVLYLAWDIFDGGARVYVFGGSESTLVMPSGSQVPVRIIYNIDALSMFMAVISVTIAFIGAIYAHGFLKGYTGMDKFYTLLLLMLVGMLGLVLTGDLFNLFVFFEILSIASAALVAFRDDKPDGFEAGFKYMTISVLAGLFLLLAIGILYGAYGHLNMAVIAGEMSFNQLDRIALVLLIGVFAMKCASVPMHMWAPDTYSAAPAPITIILVGASQASLYALMRITFTMYGPSMDPELVGWVIIILGILSMFIGISMALMQTDLKRFIAYAAISQTGYMLMALGVGMATLGDPAAMNEYGLHAITGGLFHIMNEIFTMGLLFLAAGAVYHRIGTRDMNKMGGLAHQMGYTSFFFLLGALAVSGIPPFNGFASKIIIYESVFRFNPVLAIIGLVVSLLTLAAFVRVFYTVFMGAPKKKYQQVTEVPRPMLLSMTILAVLIIFLGLFPNLVVERFVEPAAQALANPDEYLRRIGVALGGA